ncbi:hypothetical protein TNCV_1552852 [Trichonephila clavipes]|nr:hypothetical protein TNCV_1552852 [Trichonephila clavipes]
MVWDGVMFDHRTPLVHIDGCLTEGRCVTLVEPIVLPLLQDAPHTVFDTDNDRPQASHKHNQITNSPYTPKQILFEWNLHHKSHGGRGIATTLHMNEEKALLSCQSLQQEGAPLETSSLHTRRPYLLWILNIQSETDGAT